MKTEGVKEKLRVKMTRFAVRYDYACADHVITMWYDSEENNILFDVSHGIWIGRSDDENDRWDGVSHSLLQEH
jgi:hypothetical protein